MYETAEEASTRLHSTVFLYKDNPVFCESVFTKDNGDIALKCVVFPQCREYVTIDLLDGQAEYHRFNIGYCNLQNGASYLTRIPCRGQYKQGLYKGNMNCSPPVEGKGRPDFGPVSKTIGFRDMLLNKYPNFTEAVERLSEGPDDGKPFSVAFHRSFAVHRDNFRGDVILNYKGERIGFGTNGFKLPTEFQHLREVILKSGIKVQ